MTSLDIMVDLETVGSSPGCGIFAIGAVAFSPQESWVGEPFFALVNLPSCQEVGLKENPATLKWWSEQSPEARVYLEAAQAGQGENLRDAMERYGQYLAQWKEVRQWGNGSDFDNAIIRAACDHLRMPTPWAYRGSRCHRTMAAERPDIKLERMGTFHNALDDALSQAHQMTRILRAIRGMEPMPVDIREMEGPWVIDPVRFAPPPRRPTP